jgi:bifunctional enzyme CysN/CysC
VLRPNLNFRGFSGTIASGIIRTGDEVMSLPSRRTSKIKSIYGPDGVLPEAFAPMAVTVTLEHEIDVSRGNMLVPVKNLPHVGNEFEAMVVWMHEVPAQKGRSYLIKQTTNMVPGVLADIRYKVDVNTMRKQQAEPAASADVESETLEVGSDTSHTPHSTSNNHSGEAELQLNEIARVHMTLHRPIAFDPYEKNRQTGAFIIIDRMTNITIGAGMIVDRVVSKPKSSAPVSKNIMKSDSLVSAADRQSLLSQKGATLWLTGLSGSGKSTIARQLERELIDMGHACYILDGDNIRHGLNKDLGFAMEDRTENIRRIAEVARLFNEAGLIVITAFISPYRADRDAARTVIGNGFVEVFVDTPIAVCEQRDPKGLYKKARTGEIQQFTGISDPYEAPEKPELVLPTAELSAEQSVDVIIAKLRSEGIIG